MGEFLMWRKLLKNIQISSQRGKQKDIILPPEEEPEEDCYEWFKQLYLLIQGEVVEPEMHGTKDFKDYTNELLWCPLKKTIAVVMRPHRETSNAKTIEISSQVILPGERVNFTFSFDIPAEGKKLSDLGDITLFSFFELHTTSDRFEVDFFVAAATKPKSYRHQIGGDSGGISQQLKKYTETIDKIIKHIKGVAY